MDIQRGKLIGQNGPGSLYIDTNGVSYIISAADKWFDKNGLNTYIDTSEFEVHNPRLERILNVDKFYIAPDYRKNSDKKGISKLKIPVERFPKVEYCSKCYLIKESAATRKTKLDMCPDCKKRTYFIQFPVIIVCKEGHLSEFPYDEFVHVNTEKSDEIHHVYLKKLGSSILTSRLECSCGASHSLNGITGQALGDNMTPFQKEMGDIKCRGERPWCGSNDLNENKDECHSNPTAILRNALSVYQAEIVSALSLNTTQNNVRYSSMSDILLEEFESLSKHSSDLSENLKLIVRESFKTSESAVIKKSELCK